MGRIIKNWDGLRQIDNESETHILTVGKYDAWLTTKNWRKYDDSIDYLEQVKYLDVYLSTLTFYKENYKFSTQVLQACGFDVELTNWDEIQE